MNFLNLFYLYFGNWQVIAMISCMYYLMLRAMKHSWYHKFWNSLQFNSKWFYATLGVINAIIFRELLLYPFRIIQTWMPESYFWEQIIMWLYTTHVVSIVLYVAFIYYFWKKYDNLIPAIILGFFCIGIIELTFIPQHMMKWGFFMGVNWYSPFAIAVIPLLIEYKKFRIGNWKMLIVFLGLAFANQYLILPFADYSLSVFDYDLFAYRLNYALLPHPPVFTWIFVFLQTTMKTFFLLGLSNIVVKERS